MWVAASIFAGIVAVIAAWTARFPRTRIQYIEIHDEEWCPPAFRRSLQNYLAFMWSTFQLHRAVLPKLLRAVQATGDTRILDLCSGGGGPAPQVARSLSKLLNKQIGVTLTDLYPNVAAWSKLSGVSFEAKPVDATNVPAGVTGFRTLFACFHHFPATLGKSMLQDAINQRAGIAVIEATQRTIGSALWYGFLTIGGLLAAPLVRPLYWGHFFPLFHLGMSHDGIVSSFRTYTTDEMRTMVSELKNHDRYQWDIGTAYNWWWPVGITYCIGVPR